MVILPVNSRLHKSHGEQWMSETLYYGRAFENIRAFRPIKYVSAGVIEVKLAL